MTTVALDRQGFAAMIRPRILLLVLAQTAAGYLLVRPESLAVLPWVLLGTALVSMAGCSLNHYLEREADARMMRTRLRPLVTGALSPKQVVTFGVACLVAGLLVLQLGCGPAAHAHRGARRGALPGRLHAAQAPHVHQHLDRRHPRRPALLAGAAAGGEAQLRGLHRRGAGVPVAAPTLLRDRVPVPGRSTARAGCACCRGDDPDDSLLRWQMPMQVMSVVLVSVLPILEGRRGSCTPSPPCARAVFLWAALRFRRRAGEAEARGVVRASVLYLPLVLGALVFDTACTPHADLDGHDHDHATGPVAEVADCCAAEAGEAGEAALAAAEPCCDDEGTEAACCDETAVADADSDPGSDLANAIVAAADGEGLADAAPESPNLSKLPPGIREVDGVVAASLDDGTGLPAYGAVPEFSLFAESGAPFGRADMLGDVWVVDFIFTRCGRHLRAHVPRHRRHAGGGARHALPLGDRGPRLRTARTCWPATARSGTAPTAGTLLTGSNENHHRSVGEGLRAARADAARDARRGHAADLPQRQVRPGGHRGPGARLLRPRRPTRDAAAPRGRRRPARGGHRRLRADGTPGAPRRCSTASPSSS